MKIFEEKKFNSTNPPWSRGRPPDEPELETPMVSSSALPSSVRGDQRRSAESRHAMRSTTLPCPRDDVLPARTRQDGHHAPASGSTSNNGARGQKPRSAESRHAMRSTRLQRLRDGPTPARTRPAGHHAPGSVQSSCARGQKPLSAGAQRVAKN